MVVRNEIARMQSFSDRNMSEEYVYKSQYHLLAKHGLEYKSNPLTEEEKSIVQFALEESGQFKKKQCYYNSLHLLMADTTDSISYVEGIAYIKGLIPLSHAWCEINGKIIDPTWGDEPILGTIPDEWEYIGIKLPKEYVLKEMFDRGHTASLIDDWEKRHPLLKVDYTQFINKHQ